MTAQRVSGWDRATTTLCDITKMRPDQASSANGTAGSKGVLSRGVLAGLWLLTFGLGAVGV